MGVSEGQINNIMGGMEQTAGVRLHNHRHKLKQRFDIVKKLGQGTYGKVQLAINKETGQEVAIKTIKKAKIETEQDLVRIRREIQIMSSVTHPHIIHIFEVFENREKMVLVMEYAAGGELYDYLSERKVLSELEARRVFRQVATACFYCHKHKICHRDLKLENILLDEYGNAKIADFGLSNVFDERRQLATFCGSPLYASPEIVRGTPYVGPEVDCWSLGVLLYTLVYGAMPFDGSNFKKLVKQITTGDYYEPKKRSPASELIAGLLAVSAERRSTIENICSHWWVNKGSDSCCLRVAEDLACQTPVRLDLLLSLAPQSNDKEHMLTPGDEEMSETPTRTPSRTPSKGSRTDADAFAASRSRSLGSLMEVEPAGAQAMSPPRPSPPAAAAAESAAKRSLEEDSYGEPAPSKKSADREERRARKKDGERTLKRKKKRAESAARETPTPEVAGSADPAAAVRREERAAAAGDRAAEAAARPAARGLTPEAAGRGVKSPSPGRRSPAADRRKSPSAKAAARSPALSPTGGRSPEPVASARSLSPAPSSAAPLSPVLSPVAPRSPALTPVAPRSPALTPVAPRSPTLTPVAPRSPALTPKTARSPEPAPKPCQPSVETQEVPHHPAAHTPIASHHPAGQAPSASHSPATLSPTAVRSPEPELRRSRTPETALKPVRSPERTPEASRLPKPTLTSTRVSEPTPATVRSAAPSPAPASLPAALSAPVSPPAPQAPQSPAAQTAPVSPAVTPVRPRSPAASAAARPQPAPQTAPEPAAAATGARPRSPARPLVSPPPPEVLVQRASGESVAAAAELQEAQPAAAEAVAAAASGAQMLDAPQADLESRRESADSASSKASHNGDALGRRNSKIYKAAAMWDNMIAPPEPAAKTLERPKKVIRDSLKLEPKPKPEPKLDEKKKPVLGLFSGIKVSDAKRAFESKPKEVLKPIPLRKKGIQAKSVILQDAGGPIPMKDMTGRVYSSKSSGTVLKEPVGKVKKTKAKENGVGSGKTETKENSDKSPEKKEKSPEKKEKSFKTKENAKEKSIDSTPNSGDKVIAASDAQTAPTAAATSEKKVVKKKRKERPVAVTCSSGAQLQPCPEPQPCAVPQTAATAQVAAHIGDMVSAIREVGEAISQKESEIKKNEEDIAKKVTESDQKLQGDSQRPRVASESEKRLSEPTSPSNKQPATAVKGKTRALNTSSEQRFPNSTVQQTEAEQKRPEQEVSEIAVESRQSVSTDTVLESKQPTSVSREETHTKLQPSSPEQALDSKPKAKPTKPRPTLVIPERGAPPAAAGSESRPTAAPQTAPAGTARPAAPAPAPLTPRDSESSDTLSKIFRHAETKDSRGTENRFIQDVAARRRSDADQRTKYATLPAKKKTELRVVLGQERRPADGGPPAGGPPARRPSDVRSELETAVNSPSSTQRSEVTFSVAAPDRAHSLPPQRAGSREHVIRISMDGGGAAAEPAAAPPSPRPAAHSVRHAASLQSLPERQRLTSEGDMRQAVLRSLPRARSQLSSPAASGVTSPPPPAEPIRKSRREFIIPIALEGGGTLTPPVRAPSEEAERAQGAGLFRSQRLSGSAHRRMGLAPRPRSGFSVERSESFSSAGEDEEDEDQFEILTAESLFTTLLDRVRNLTRRVSTEDSPLKRTMMLANQPSGATQQQQQQQQQPGIWGMPSPMRSLFDQPLGFPPHTSLFDQPPTFSRQSSGVSQRSDGSAEPQQEQQQGQPTWRRTKSREDAFSTLPKNFRRRGQCFETDEDPANYTRSLPRRYTARAPSKDLPSIDDDEPAEPQRPAPQPYLRQPSQQPSPSPSPMSPEPLARPRKFLAYKKSSTADSPLGGPDPGSNAERAGSARDFISRFLRQDPALGRASPAPAAAAAPPEPAPAPAYRVYTRTSSREYPPAEQTAATAAAAAAAAASEPPKVAWRPRSLHSTFRPPGEANGRDGGRSAASQQQEPAAGPARRRSLIDAPPGGSDGDTEPEPPAGRPRANADEVRRSLGRALSMRLGDGRRETGAAPRARSHSRAASRSPDRAAADDSDRTPVPSPETRRPADRTSRRAHRGDPRPASAGHNYADAAGEGYSRSRASAEPSSARDDYRSGYVSGPRDYRRGSRPRSPREELRLSVEPRGGGGGEYRQSVSPGALSPTDSLYAADTYRYSSPFTRSSERSVQSVLKDIRQKRESMVSPPPVPEAEPELEAELGAGLRPPPQQQPVQRPTGPGADAAQAVDDAETWQDEQDAQDPSRGAAAIDSRIALDAPKKADKSERSVFDEISRKTAKLLNLDRGKDEETKSTSEKRPDAEDTKEKKSSLTQKLSRIPSLIRRAGSRSEVKADEESAQERDRRRPADSSGVENQPPTPINPDLLRDAFNHYPDSEKAPPASPPGARPGSRRQSLGEPEERTAREPRESRRGGGVRSAVSRLQHGDAEPQVRNIAGQPVQPGRQRSHSRERRQPAAATAVIDSGEHQLQNGPVSNGPAEPALNGCPEPPAAGQTGGYPENGGGGGGGESERRRPRRQGRRLSADTDPASENTDTSELTAADDEEDSVSDRILRKSYFSRFNDRRRDRSASREVLSLIYDEPAAEPRRGGRRERDPAGRSSSLRAGEPRLRSSSRDPSEAADGARYSSSTLPRRRKLGSAGCLPTGDEPDATDSREALSSSNVSLRSSRESLPSDSAEPRPSRLSSIEESRRRTDLDGAESRRPGRGGGDAPYFRAAAAPAASNAEFYRRHTAALGPAIASSRLSSIGDQLKRDLDSVTSNIESLKEARKSRSTGTASQPQLRRYSRYGSGGSGPPLGGGGGGGGLSFSSSSWRYL